MVGGPSEVYASFLCGMGPQGEDLLKQLVVRDGTALLKAGHQRSRQVMRDGTAGVNSYKMVCGMGPQGSYS